MISITSTLELQERLINEKNLALLVSANQCSLLPINLGQVIKDVKEKNLAFYQVDSYQVPRIFSLFQVKTGTSYLLIFKEGQLCQKKEF